MTNNFQITPCNNSQHVMSKPRQISPHDPRQAVFARLQPICTSLRQFVVGFNDQQSKKQSIQASWEPCSAILDEFSSYLQKWESVNTLTHPLRLETTSTTQPSLCSTNHFNKMPYFVWHCAIDSENEINTKKNGSSHSSSIITPLRLVLVVLFFYPCTSYPCTNFFTFFFFLCVFDFFVYFCFIRSWLLLCSFIGFNEYCNIL